MKRLNNIHKTKTGAVMKVLANTTQQVNAWQLQEQLRKCNGKDYLKHGEIYTIIGRLIKSGFVIENQDSTLRVVEGSLVKALCRQSVLEFIATKSTYYGLLLVGSDYANMYLDIFYSEKEAQETRKDIMADTEYCINDNIKEIIVFPFNVNQFVRSSLRYSQQRTRHHKTRSA